MSNISQQQIKHFISPSLEFFINLSRMQSTVARKFDHMGSTVGFTDFIILYHLGIAPDNKLRRIDLADKVGLTASGITRLLPPLEKIGLVGREADPRDARVSYVTLAPGGKRVLNESIERAELTASSIIPTQDIPYIDKFVSLNEDIRRLAA